MGFQNLQAAKLFRDEWFGRYHSTVKGFVKAGEQGMLPRMPDGTKREFDRDHLISYYGKACDPNQGLKYLLPCVDNALQRILGDLRNRGIQLVIFTNGPRAYGLRVLKALKLLRYFDNHLIFGVDTIAPFCKPERESFLEVLRRVGADPSRSVMFEDSYVLSAHRHSRLVSLYSPHLRYYTICAAQTFVTHAYLSFTHFATPPFYIAQS